MIFLSIEGSRIFVRGIAPGSDRLSNVIWKWSNVPIPAPYLIVLVLGVVLHLTIDTDMFKTPTLGRVAGVIIAAAGVCLAVWAVLEAANVSVDSPNKLITSGPFSMSRNPMYLAWTFMFIGVAFIVNSWLMIVTLPFVAAYTHIVDVRKEERFLADKFGDEFDQYKSNVRRYF